MSFEEIARLLPEEPSPEFRSWALFACDEQLGGEYAVFHRESLSLADSCEELSDPEFKRDHRLRNSRIWGAVCTCSACGEEWIAGWCRAGKHKGIRVCIGEDGHTYDGLPVNIQEEYGQTIDFLEEESVYCPLCGADTRLVHKSSLRQGRTYAAMAAQVARVENYTVLLYWLIRRHWDEWGLYYTDVRPREAILLDEKGRLLRFSHAKYGELFEMPSEKWEHRTFRDPASLAYYSYGGGWGTQTRNTVGAFWWPHTPEMKGSTGEKTGLCEFVQEAHGNPLIYLKLWRKHPAVENLLKAGWAFFIAREIERQESAASYYMKTVSAEMPWLDFEKVAPHKMLNMSRPEVKTAAAYRWNADQLRLWLDYSELYGKRAKRPDWLHDMMRRYSAAKLNQIFAMECDGWEACDLHKVCNYLGKQDLPMQTAAQMFIDYRQMLEEQLQGAPASELQLWPPTLLVAHDALARTISIDSDPERAKLFRQLKEKYTPLEWTDGEFCIVVPSSNTQLVAEGKTLDHCVGRYGKQHCEGQPIFFVRKYRRPERSYYTLNENLNGLEPARVQLHGYKNDRIKGKPRSIPPKVLAFVERWEKEVLLPWHRENMANEPKKKEKRRITAA